MRPNGPRKSTKSSALTIQLWTTLGPKLQKPGAPNPQSEAPKSKPTWSMHCKVGLESHLRGIRVGRAPTCALSREPCDGWFAFPDAQDTFQLSEENLSGSTEAVDMSRNQVITIALPGRWSPRNKKQTTTSTALLAISELSKSVP